MKTIVVSGARSNVGKTTLSMRISEVLPGSVCVKLGHGEEKEGLGNRFYHAGTDFGVIAAENSQAQFLIIESNRVLEEIEPDLAIYIPAEGAKPSAALAERRADLVSGCAGSGRETALIAARLGVDDATAAKIARLACGAGAGRDGKDER